MAQLNITVCRYDLLPNRKQTSAINYMCCYLSVYPFKNLLKYFFW